MKAEIVSGGSVVTASSALTFSAHPQLVLTVVPSTGALTVAGATTGNGTASGTPFTFTEDTLRVGGVLSATSEAFGRITQPVSV